VFSATNSVMGAYNLTQLVSLDKEEIKTAEIQAAIEARVAEVCKSKYGITVADVSILRLSLPDTILTNVFKQMEAERQKEIDAILSEAARKANEITAGADTEAAEIIASGTTISAEIKAQTEAEVASIYAAAQAENLELYQFLKQLDSIVASVGNSTVLVVKANEYPFNVLFEYGSSLEDVNADSVKHDLSYILAKLPEADREALVAAIYEILASYPAGGK
jgi:regulator of protease activity HflC (stomatin/prohibitin superfamily)